MSRKVFTAGEVLAAADVNSFLMDQSVMSFAGTAARGSAIPSPVEGMVAYLEDLNLLTTYNGSSWTTVANAGTASYNLAQTVYFTSSGTFTKATYPWLRAMKVRVQGAGGGGAGCAANVAAAGGGGGAYAETFITDIASLDSSVTITIGGGGTGGAAGGGASSAGGTTVFGPTKPFAVSANGGEGNQATNAAFGGRGSKVGTGTIVIAGGSADNAGAAGGAGSTAGGSSHLGGGGNAGVQTIGATGGNYGGGGGAAGSTVDTQVGGTGAPGIVILELYA
jgi:hypothetical protein